MIYIFDLWGTIAVSKSGYSVAQHENDIDFLPVLSKIDRINEKHKTAICTNWEAVGKGFMRESVARRILHVVRNYLEIDYFEVCFHARGNKEYRDILKPKPEMLFRICDSFPDENEAIFIGNQTTDQRAAINAAIRFMWAHDFFQWPLGFVEQKENGYFPKSWLEKWRKRKEVYTK